MRIKFHPLFFLLALVLVSLGQAIPFVCAFVAVLLHELAHALMARGRGYRLREIVLLPFGAVLYGEENIERTSSVLIALAGPIANGVLALFTLASWWLYPATYTFTEPFLWANIAIGSFNLLPAFPLDGSRVVLALSKNKSKALKALRWCGVVLSFVCFALFIVSAFFEINFTLGIIAVFLFLGATFGTNREMYLHIADQEFKNFRDGICERVVHIDSSVSLLRVLRHLKSDYVTSFIVVGEKGEQICKMDETAMRKLLEQNSLNISLSQALKISLPPGINKMDFQKPLNQKLGKSKLIKSVKQN